jgi:hypothetical protein
MSAVYPGPDSEFVLMQHAADVVNGAAEDLAYDELIPEVQAVHLLGSAATNAAIEEMFETLEADLALLGDAEGFGDTVEADLAANPVATKAEEYLRRRTPSTGVTLAKEHEAGTPEPDMAYRVALDTLRGRFAHMATDLPRPVDLVKRPKS